MGLDQPFILYREIKRLNAILGNQSGQIKFCYDFSNEDRIKTIGAKLRVNLVIPNRKIIWRSDTKGVLRYSLSSEKIGGHFYLLYYNKDMSWNSFSWGVDVIRLGFLCGSPYLFLW